MELQLKDVTKKYGEKVALDRFSYTFRPGIYGILGANGAGKSTMMNLITDNLRRDGGEITFDGTDIRKLGIEFRRILGYMTQQQGLFEGMTAESFLIYMARLKEIPRKQTLPEVDRVLEMTNLQDVRHKKVGAFSGGMKQRVLLARALCAAGDLLVLDEPVTGLDPAAADDLYRTLRYLNRTEGMAVVMVTHDIRSALRDATAILHAGRNQWFLGTPREYLASPYGKRFGGDLS